MKKINTVLSFLSFISYVSGETPETTPSAPGQTYTETIVYNPERGKYNARGTTALSTKKEDCPFCKKLALHTDPEYMILARYTYNYIMLCEYPYLTGHLLILPLEHHARLSDLSVAARTELIALLSEATTIIGDYLKTEDLNIGINTGKAAGGSVPGHLHVHILPRKLGDTSFSNVLGKMNLITTDMKKMYADLSVTFQALSLDKK